jgi:hypothetical protein
MPLAGNPWGLLLLTLMNTEIQASPTQNQPPAPTLNLELLDSQDEDHARSKVQRASPILIGIAGMQSLHLGNTNQWQAKPTPLPQQDSQWNLENQPRKGSDPDLMGQASKHDHTTHVTCSAAKCLITRSIAASQTDRLSQGMSPLRYWPIR